MGKSLHGWSVLVAGGDARETVLAGELAGLGAQVWLLGFDRYAVTEKSLLNFGLPGRVDAVICPLAGIDKNGNIYAPYAQGRLEFVSLKPVIKKGLLMLCGSAPEKWLAELERLGVRIILTGDMDELAIYNAIPTAEGTLEIAMRESDITIHGSKSLVIGFGRCGLPLAKALQGLGSEVTVAARRREVLAQAFGLGRGTVGFECLAGCIGKFDFIFNTVPALVLAEKIISLASRNAIIIDIASAPGGTDFEAADKYGIKSILAPGLPGKTAPRTAGLILARVYPDLLITLGKGAEQDET